METQKQSFESKTEKLSRQHDRAIKELEKKHGKKMTDERHQHAANLKRIQEELQSEITAARQAARAHQHEASQLQQQLVSVAIIVVYVKFKNIHSL